MANTDQFRRASAKLAHENRALRRVHDALGQSLATLMDVDLLKARSTWKQLWQDMQKEVGALAERYPPDRTRRWIEHWDRQVYKALEAAYCAGLETLDESLSLPDSLRVELGFSGGTEVLFVLFLALADAWRLVCRQANSFSSLASRSCGPSTIASSKSLSPCPRLSAASLAPTRQSMMPWPARTHRLSCACM